MSTAVSTKLDTGDDKEENGNLPLLCANLIAIALGLLLAVPLMLTTFPTLSGNNHPAARLCIAPMEDPTLA